VELAEQVHSEAQTQMHSVREPETAPKQQPHAAGSKYHPGFLNQMKEARLHAPPVQMEIKLAHPQQALQKPEPQARNAFSARPTAGSADHLQRKTREVAQA
jgi:hypothetical protein